MQEYIELETLSRKTLLGIRFWDAVVGAPIIEGLLVTLSPQENSDMKRVATRSSSGIYAFNNIPGMHDYEVNQHSEFFDSPAATKPFVLHVRDIKKRYSDAVLAIDLPLPYDGVFLIDDDRGSPAVAPKGFNLYSSTTREGGPQYGFVRGQLVHRDTGGPASFALVQVQTETGFFWYAIADKEGQFAVMMPYPMISMTLGGSPPSSEGTRLMERTWEVSVTIMYDPHSQATLPGFDSPDYLSILNQSPAAIFADSPGVVGGEADEVSLQIMYGRDLIVTTQGFSELYINPIGSPA